MKKAQLKIPNLDWSRLEKLHFNISNLDQSRLNQFQLKISNLDWSRLQKVQLEKMNLDWSRLKKIQLKKKESGPVQITDLDLTFYTLDIDNGTVEKLESLQCNFLRILLATPASTPQAALIWDCGALKIKYRIMESKLNFLHYLLNQSDESLGHQILMEQKNQDFPGLVRECDKFIKELEILDPFQLSMSKNEWKRIVKGTLSPKTISKYVIQLWTLITVS